VKILNIVETAFRGTIEEQDDTVVWTCHAMLNSGQDLSVLLRANAVGHAVRGQDASGLSFGGKVQTNPVDLAGDLEKIIAAGADVFYVSEDIKHRGISESELIDGLKAVTAKEVASLCDGHDIIWHW
jgi:sulfur transfer complex TusBCD TusB component (DsrH family)